MRKYIGDRASPLNLHKVPDRPKGVTPFVRMSATDTGVSFTKKNDKNTEYRTAFDLRDEDAIREVHDQLGEWLARHANETEDDDDGR